jgi:hypothetical protein
MNNSFTRFGGYSAILVGILSILYAVFYLLISRTSPGLGVTGSWIILSVSGLFSSAAYVALYEQVKPANPGFAGWAALSGVVASLATLVHGGYETILINASQPVEPARQAALAVLQSAPSQVDPAGLMTFFLTGIILFTFSALLSRTPAFPKALGTLGMVNGVVLIILYIATAAQITPLILASGGLTSVILGPIWWIWLGSRLNRISSNPA